jgi:hypothetical protein
VDDVPRSLVVAQFRIRLCRWMWSTEPSDVAGDFGRRHHAQHGLSGLLCEPGNRAGRKV